MEQIEVLVARREPTNERRLVYAPVQRRVVVATKVAPAVVKAKQNRERQKRWYKRRTT